jgi:translation initiation factor IF-3
MAFTPHGGGPNRPKPQAPGNRPGQPQSGGPRPARPQFNQQNDKDTHRINEQIRGVREVRLVGENIESGIYSIQDAMRMADEQELDLVEISASANPPVCKIMDYQKFCYQQKKKAKEIKAKAAKVVIKEIRFGPQTDDHDYEFKLRHAREFIGEGSKVKAYVFFKGRSILFKEQGEVLLLRFANDLEDCAKVESMPVLEGKRMILMLSPKAKKA